MQRGGKGRHVLDVLCGMFERSTTCVACITENMCWMYTTAIRHVCLLHFQWHVFPPAPARELPPARLRQLPPPRLRTISRRRVCGSFRRRAYAPAPAGAFAAPAAAPALQLPPAL